MNLFCPRFFSIYSWIILQPSPRAQTPNVNNSWFKLIPGIAITNIVIHLNNFPEAGCLVICCGQLIKRGMRACPSLSTRNLNHLEKTGSVAFSARSLGGLIFLGWHTLECSTRAANEIYPLMGLERITREGVAILKLSSMVTVFPEATLMSLLKTKPVCSGM